MKSIAIVGTGIAGMASGYFLKDDYDITFFEKNDYAGGHTNTLSVNEDGKEIHIDSGFMVYNEVTYPNLTRLFKQLNVETKATDMSFSVQHKPTGLEYCGTGVSGLFAQRKNLINIRFLKQLRDMDRFNREAVEVLTDEKYLSYTLAQYAKEKGFGQDLLDKYLTPMSSAVWSTPPDQMLEFPVVTLVRFFKNHGFLGLTTHYQWRTVVGGSRMYRDKIISMFENKVFLNNPVIKIARANNKVSVTDSTGEARVFDKVIVAAHADETLELLADPTDDEKSLLSKFKYQKNKATLHTDSSLMPKTRRAWSSWNYRIKEDAKGAALPSTIYYMNSLQSVSQKKDYFVSINDHDDVSKEKILWEKMYDHPIFTVESIKAQERLPQLNKNQTTYFCGSYFKYGFHEDALTSAIDVAQEILGRRVWP